MVRKNNVKRNLGQKGDRFFLSYIFIFLNILLLASCNNHKDNSTKKNKVDLFDTLQNSTNVFLGKRKSPATLNINEIFDASDVVVTCIPLKMDSVLNKLNKPIFYLVGTRVIKVLKGRQKPYDVLYFVSNARPQFKPMDTVAAYLSQLRNKKLLAYNFKWQWTFNAPYLNQYDELGKPKDIKRSRLSKGRRRRIRYLKEIDLIRIAPDLDSNKLDIIRNFTTIKK